MAATSVSNMSGRSSAMSSNRSYMTKPQTQSRGLSSVLADAYIRLLGTKTPFSKSSRTSSLTTLSRGPSTSSKSRRSDDLENQLGDIVLTISAPNTTQSENITDDRIPINNVCTLSRSSSHYSTENAPVRTNSRNFAQFELSCAQTRQNLLCGEIEDIIGELSIDKAHIQTVTFDDIIPNSTWRVATAVRRSSANPMDHANAGHGELPQIPALAHTNSHHETNSAFARPPNNEYDDNDVYATAESLASRSYRNCRRPNRATTDRADPLRIIKYATAVRGWTERHPRTLLFIGFLLILGTIFLVAYLVKDTKF